MSFILRGFSHQLPYLLQLLDTCTFFTANIFFLVFTTHGWPDIQQHAGTLAVFNFTPLYAGLVFGLPADLLGVYCSRFAWAYQWLGRAAVSYILVHGTIVLVVSYNPINVLKHHLVSLLVGIYLLLLNHKRGAPLIKPT